LTYSQLAFVAPETGFNLQHANIQTDIYAFGMLLNTMILGHFPFNGKNAPMMYQDILAHKDAPSLRDLAPGVDPDFVRIIDWCTAFNPLARYQSMSDVLRDLYIVLPKLQAAENQSHPIYK
jgi:serine/threonine-protein kinase